MLRSVLFKNFVKFKEYQVMDFSSDGPFILIGENGSGKSSVLEGIRRCLKLELSTSMSSIFDMKRISYFICTAETGGLQDQKKNIFGIVTMPKNDELTNEDKIDGQFTSDLFEGSQAGPRMMGVDKKVTMKQPTHQNSSSQKEIKSEDIEENISKAKDTSLTQSSSNRFYKFATSKDTDDEILIDLITPSFEGDQPKLIDSYSYTRSNAQFIQTVLKHNPEENVTESCINSLFGNLHKDPTPRSGVLNELLCDLTNQFVFTFPLRSIGPLQWSESPRITSACREENYNEAEYRCEIIKYFLQEKDKKFEMAKEKEFSQQLIGDYHFMLEDGRITTKEKFGLLKTPEGILEAKIFSILISSKTYKTILLEEPDRGMHPQLVQKIIQIMKQEKNRKRVILTTHQKGFISSWTILDTFIFTCSENENAVISGKTVLDVKNTSNRISSAKTVSMKNKKGNNLDMKTEEKDPGIMKEQKDDNIKKDERDTEMKNEEKYADRKHDGIDANINQKAKDSSIQNEEKDAKMPIEYKDEAMKLKGNYSSIKSEEKEDYVNITEKDGNKGNDANMRQEANMKQMRLLTCHHVPDIFFAKKVLFYEGDSEQLFLDELKCQILAGESNITSKFLNGDDKVAANKRLKKCMMEYTLIKMNSKYNRVFYSTVADNLKLHYLLVVDRDTVWNILTQNKGKKEKKDEEDLEKTRTQEEWKNIRNRKELKDVFFWLDGSIENMVTVMCDGDRDLENSLEEQNVIKKQNKSSREGGQPIQISEKKIFLDEKIGIGNVKESVKLLLDHCNPWHDLAVFINILAE